MSKQKFHPFKKGMFDFETLTVRFGGEKSKPENIFTATAVRVPTFKYKKYEHVDAGGGSYYSRKEWNEYTENNAYIILKDGEVIGWMKPYHACHNLKSDLYPLDWKYTDEPIKDFAKTLSTPALA